MTAESYSRIIISGAGFLADAYDLFVINIVVDLMGLVSYHEALTPSRISTLKSTALIGAIIGQLGFGVTADIIGRRKVFILTCSFVIIGALMSACVIDTTTPGFGIYSQLSFWRFLLGVGVGGEYPLSAAITSESSEIQDQARNLALVFSMQGIGTILCAIVLVMVTTLLPKGSYDMQWRIALAMGAFPMVCAFYFRWKLHETSWPTLQESVQQKTLLLSSLRRWSSFVWHGWLHIQSVIQENRWRLVGTAGSWFILDVVFYANGLFSGQVSKTMGIAHGASGEALASLVLQAIALPGYFCTVLFIRRVGSKRLQGLGFFLTSIFFFLLAACQPVLIKIPSLYIFLYGITFFFQNFGANATTYIIPSMIYSVEHRATCHGISSAAGKLGAVVGAQLFLTLEDAYCKDGVCTENSTPAEVNAGLQTTFGVCGAFGILGLLLTHFFVEEDALHCSRTEKDANGLSLYTSTVHGIRNSRIRSFELIPTTSNTVTSRLHHSPFEMENEAEEFDDL